MPNAAEIRPFFDEATKTVTYLVWDPLTREARSSIRCWISIRPRARSAPPRPSACSPPPRMPD